MDTGQFVGYLDVQPDSCIEQMEFSEDGRFLTFAVDGRVFVWNIPTGEVTFMLAAFFGGREGRSPGAGVAGVEPDGDSGGPAISSDGRYVAFWSFATNLVPETANGFRDIYVHDRETGETPRVSVSRYSEDPTV